MARNLYDHWCLWKSILHIPLPFHSHFHKGKRIKAMKYIFCRDCTSVSLFEAYRNKKERQKPLSQIKFICPRCASSNITFSTDLAKAIIEKRSTEYLIKLVEKQDEENRQITERLNNKSLAHD